MRTFTCVCGQAIYFDNVQCVRCGRKLAYLPDVRTMRALRTAANAPGLWEPEGRGARGGPYRLCRNTTEHAVCNWVVRAEDANELCVACRLNHVIPNLSEPRAREDWRRIEAAKRRLVYTLLDLGLPVASKLEDPERGLAFDFLADAGASRAFTGHVEGLITINVAEAENPFREQMREQLGERYRTLLGHFRHESGHYYWSRLVDGTPRLAEFRRLFGDERESYEDARKRHYGAGPSSGWSSRFVSAYASMHPWEDWAETWAHHLHMIDGLETARAHGLWLRGGPIGDDLGSLGGARFPDVVEDWVTLTIALNDMNRSFGMPDCYPFVLSSPVIDKLRFVHEVARRAGAPITAPRRASLQ